MSPVAIAVGVFVVIYVLVIVGRLLADVIRDVNKWDRRSR